MPGTHRADRSPESSANDAPVAGGSTATATDAPVTGKNGSGKGDSGKSGSGKNGSGGNGSQGSDKGSSKPRGKARLARILIPAILTLVWLALAGIGFAALMSRPTPTTVSPASTNPGARMAKAFSHASRRACSRGRSPVSGVSSISEGIASPGAIPSRASSSSRRGLAEASVRWIYCGPGPPRPGMKR